MFRNTEAELFQDIQLAKNVRFQVGAFRRAHGDKILQGGFKSLFHHRPRFFRRKGRFRRGSNDIQPQQVGRLEGQRLTCQARRTVQQLRQGSQFFLIKLEGAVRFLQTLHGDGDAYAAAGNGPLHDGAHGGVPFRTAARHVDGDFRLFAVNA